MQHDVTHAKYELGLMHQAGRGIPVSYETAAVLWKSAADDGYAKAQFALALLYDDGLGVEKSKAKAFEYFMLAAQQGEPMAMFQVGVRYEEGIGVEASQSEAMRWIRMAAEEGDVRANFELGWMNYFGIGCGVSEKEAKRLILNALDRGALELIRNEAARPDAIAQVRLGWLYDIGWGVEQSDYVALAWYSGARVLGYPNADRFIEVLNERIMGRDGSRAVGSGE